MTMSAAVLARKQAQDAVKRLPLIPVCMDMFKKSVWLMYAAGYMVTGSCKGGMSAHGRRAKLQNFSSLPHFAPRVIVAKDGLTAKHSIQGKQAKEARMQALYTAPKRPLEGDNPWIMTYAMALAPYTPGAKATKMALADSLMVSMEMRPPLIITTAVGLPT